MPQAHGDNASDHPSLCGTDEHVDDIQGPRVEVLPSMQKPKVPSLSQNYKRQRRYTLQQVISVRQQKIYEQQCEIEELRRRIREVGNDNKFLREQNYWQAKALEKLDGKHAELPQLINGHLEEIRVFREQIRRMKDALKLEKQRRHDAEAANEKALFELKHLRKLAEEQNLLEREELMQTIEKLQVEAAERGKLLRNLERYAENLEKNQRFESLRASKAQRDMRDTCQRLLDRIRELEQTVQEKQKIIELGNIYSKRMIKPQATTEANTSTEAMQPSTDAVNNGKVEPDCESNKNKLRERIREFDQRRQDLERKRERIRRKRMQQSNSEHLEDEDGYDAALENMELEKSDVNLGRIMVTQSETSCNAGMIELDQNTRVRVNEQNAIILPKITPKESPVRSDGKRSKSITEAKQVRFSAIIPSNGRTVDEEVIFKELQTSERLARLFAEASLERTHAGMGLDRGTLKFTEDMQVDSELAARMKAIERLSKPSLMNIQVRVKSGGQNPVQLQPSPTELGEDDQTRPKFSEVLKIEEVQTCEKPSEETAENLRQPHVVQTVHSVELHSPSSTTPVILGSPKVPRTISDLSTFDSFELVPLPEATKNICRPCGEQDLESFSTGDSSDTGSPLSADTIGSGGEEEFMWQESPSYKAGSSSCSSHLQSRVYRGPNGLLVNASNDVEGLDIEYITETVFGPVQVNTTETAKGDVMALNDAPPTKTLYTMINNNAEQPEE